MVRDLFRSGVLLLGLFAGAVAQADTLVSPEALPATERGVFTSDGRYFVAGGAGIHEVRRSATDGVLPANCQVDFAQALTVCQIAAPVLDGQPCFFAGMTTDGRYLYATCTAGADLTKPDVAALYRILPGAAGAAEVKMGYFAKPVWYNGMAVAPDGGILMTNSAAGLLHRGPGAAIVKARITGTDGDSLRFSLADWLPGSLLYFMPNGIAVDGSTVYFVGGHNLLRISIKPDGRPGFPVPIYMTAASQLLDDLVVLKDRVAVAEISMFEGLGVNRLVSVPKSGWGTIKRLNTGGVRVSSLALDPGSLGKAGGLISSSYFNGGVYRFAQP